MEAILRNRVTLCAWLGLMPDHRPQFFVFQRNKCQARLERLSVASERVGSESGRGGCQSNSLLPQAGRAQCYNRKALQFLL